MHCLLALSEGERLWAKQVRVSEIHMPALIYFVRVPKGQRALLPVSHDPCEFFQMFRRLVTVKPNASVGNIFKFLKLDFLFVCLKRRFLYRAELCRSQIMLRNLEVSDAL